MAQISYGEALRRKAAEAPNRPAITDSECTWTRAEFNHLSNRIAQALTQKGISADDIVIFTHPENTAVLPAIAFAAWKLGAAPLALPAGKSTEEVEGLLKLANPKVVVGLADEVKWQGERIKVETLANLPDDAPEPDDIVPKRFRIGASGGSTSAPKLIAVDSPALIDDQGGMYSGFGMSVDGVQMLSLNLVDGAGFVMSTAGLAIGSHIVCMRSFDAERTLQLIEAHNADWMAVTPPVMLAIWKLGDEVRAGYDVSSLRAVCQVSGGVAAWLKRAWIEWLGPERILEIYGGTESRGALMISGQEWLKHPGSVGRAPSSCEVTILDDNHQTVEPGKVGEIYLRDLTGQSKFCYIGAEMETLPGGWESIGDMGWLDQDGYLYIADRRKDVIETKSGLVFPLAIEGEIERYEPVRSAIVIGLPEESGVERIHALVDAPDGIDLDALQAFLENLLPPEQQPDTFEHVQGPLRDLAGKARRSQLRADRL